MHNLSCENEFYLHENEKSFQYERLTLKLVFIQRPGETRKWPKYKLEEDLLFGEGDDFFFCLMVDGSTNGGLIIGVYLFIYSLSPGPPLVI